eukprot:scaffold146_cov374-Prasinococcus_capsulatus_cf.AAC.9
MSTRYSTPRSPYRCPHARRRGPWKAAASRACQPSARRGWRRPRVAHQVIDDEVLKAPAGPLAAVRVHHDGVLVHAPLTFRRAACTIEGWPLRSKPRLHPPSGRTPRRK